MNRKCFGKQLCVLTYRYRRAVNFMSWANSGVTALFDGRRALTIFVYV
jgi:hypothetical protein